MDVDKAIRELQHLLELRTGDRAVYDLLRGLREVETASELAAFTTGNFDRLHTLLGERLGDFIIASSSPEVWAQQGLLVNPEVIPYRSDLQETYLAISDGSVKTVQDKPVNVQYFGDVDLTISDGVAIVMDTRHPVKAENDAYVVAHGKTAVNGTGPVVLRLYDLSRAEVENAEWIELADRSFLSSKGGNPKIVAGGQAQYLISGGSATIEHKDNARGAILNAANPEGSFKVRMGGDGMLFIENSRIKNCELSRFGGRTFLYIGYANEEVKQRLLNTFVPWQDPSKQVVMKCLDTPMDISRLKEELKPFLPKMSKEESYYYEGIKSENILCTILKDKIPAMVENGLTGQFLREHFTSDGLWTARIFVENDADLGLMNRKTEPVYIFGDQTLCAQNLNCPVLGFENVVLNVKNNVTTVSQNASVFADGLSCITAKGESKAFVQDRSDLRITDHAKAFVKGDSHVLANGNAEVIAAGHTSVNGYGHAWVELCNQSKATVNQACRVVCYDGNSVESFDAVKVAYPGEDRPAVTAHNGPEALVKLDAPDALKAFKGLWEKETLLQEQKNKGLRR